MLILDDDGRFIFNVRCKQKSSMLVQSKVSNKDITFYVTLVLGNRNQHPLYIQGSKQEINRGIVA